MAALVTWKSNQSLESESHTRIMWRNSVQLKNLVTNKSFLLCALFFQIIVFKSNTLDKDGIESMLAEQCLRFQGIWQQLFMALKSDMVPL